MPTPHDDSYIQRLEEEKAALQSRIDELRRSIAVINSLITKRRSQIIFGEKGVATNKRNAEKHYFETLIFDVLDKYPNGLRTSAIYEIIKNLGHNINYNTLRSYMVRMRDEKTIKKHKIHEYNWIVSKSDL